MASCPFEAWWLFDPKPDRNLPLWSQKWKENMLQNIRLQRNGVQSPRSDNNMNDSCVKIYLTIRLRARVFYEQIVNEAQPSWLLLVENEGK